MQEFRKKQQRRRLLYSKPVLIILILVLIFLGRGAWGVFKKSSQSKENLKSAETSLVELKEQESEVKNSIAHLDTESGTEEEIRIKYNVAKEGEKAIVIVDPEGTEDVVPKDTTTSSKWDWIFFWRD